MDIIVLGVSLACLAGAGWMVATALDESKTQDRVSEFCGQRLNENNEWVKKLDPHNKNYVSDEKQRNDILNNCKNVEDSLEGMIFVWFTGSMVLMLVGITGIVWVGHRFGHEYRHYLEPTNK